MLQLPMVFLAKAQCPIAVLLFPLVFEDKEAQPAAKLSLPDILFRRLKGPNAVLLPP